jgi:hypothetical protein
MTHTSATTNVIANDTHLKERKNRKVEVELEPGQDQWACGLQPIRWRYSHGYKLQQLW